MEEKNIVQKLLKYTCKNIAHKLFLIASFLQSRLLLLRCRFYAIK